MTASYTCTDCAIRWVESDGATCPGCARRGEPALPDAEEKARLRRLMDRVRDVEAAIVRAQEADRRVAEVAAKLDPVPEVVPLVPAPAAPPEPALPAAVQPWVDAVRAVWPEARVTHPDSTYEIAVQAQSASVEGTWDAFVAGRGTIAWAAGNPGSVRCESPAALVDALRKQIPAPSSKPPADLSAAARRLLDEIDRTQRSGRTLVGFPLELLAAVEDVRAALGGER